MIPLLFLLCLQDDLVQQLGSDRIEEREVAYAKLKSLGKAALPALEKGIGSSDPEMAAQARRLVRVISLLGELSPRLLETRPGIEERLAGEDAHAWTEEFLEAIRFPQLKDEDLKLLAIRGLKGRGSGQEGRKVLQFIGDSRVRSAIPAILELLPEGEPLLRRSALDVLVSLEATEAVGEIVKLLSDRDPDLRSHALHAIQGLDAREAAPKALRSLSDDSPKVRAAAADVLGWFDVREAIPGIRKLLGDREALVRSRALTALGNLNAREAILEIVPLLADKDVEVRSTAASVLGELDATEAAPEILKLLSDRNLSVRRSATQALVTLRARPAIPKLIELLSDADVRKNALQGLGRLGAKEAIPKIRELLSDRDPFIRVQAVDALTLLGAREAVPEIVKLLSDAKGVVRMSAVHALGRLGAGESIGEIAKRLADGDESVREFAARAIGWLGAKSMASDIVKLLADASPDVRSAACEALYWLGAREAIPEIMDRLGDRDPDVRREAVRALCGLDAREAVPVFVKLSADPLMGYQAILGVGRLGRKSDVPWVRPFLRDKNEFVRLSAAVALSELDARETCPDLVPLLKHRESYETYVVARALVLLGSEEGVPWVLADERNHLECLHALRRPDSWKRLREIRLTEPLQGTTPELWAALGKLGNVKIDCSAVRVTHPQPRRLRPGIRWTDAMEELNRDEEVSAIFENDRIRIVPRDEALEFWKRWWTERRK